MGAWPRGVWGPTRCPGSQCLPRVLSPAQIHTPFLYLLACELLEPDQMCPSVLFLKSNPPPPPPVVPSAWKALSFLSFNMCSDQNFGEPSCPNDPLAFRCPFCTQGQTMVVMSLMGIRPDVVLSEAMHKEGLEPTQTQSLTTEKMKDRAPGPSKDMHSGPFCL